jgi:hypothetical protein
MQAPIDPETAPKALNDVGHLASGVGHHVINAFSAIVSNAELLRIKFGPNSPPIDPAAIADMVIETVASSTTPGRSPPSARICSTSTSSLAKSSRHGQPANRRSTGRLG